MTMAAKATPSGVMRSSLLFPIRRGRLPATVYDNTGDIAATIGLWSDAGTDLEGAQILAALPADRDEGHQAGLRQWVAPAMSRAVLHDAIALAQMDHLSVVQFQRHLAANH